ncbi:MAG: YbaK/EbsC family protein [Bacillota bacterium]|nr:YbaK/EbsC family protein [Bacillota bacterium]
MGKQQVEAFFHQIGRDDLRILEFPVSSATVELAAVAVGAPAAQIAKTLTLRLKERNIIVVMSGTARLSNHKFKEHFGCKAKLLKPEEVLAVTGHNIGGVCPFGLKTRLDVYLDQSLRAFDYVYPAAGEANNAVKIFVDEFDQLIDASWIDVSE